MIIFWGSFWFRVVVVEMLIVKSRGEKEYGMGVGEERGSRERGDGRVGRESVEF